MPGTGREHGRGEIGSGGTRLHRRHPEGASAPEGANREVHPVVFVLDKHGQPLDPCHPARARRLLAAGRAVVGSARTYRPVRKPGFTPAGSRSAPPAVSTSPPGTAPSKASATATSDCFSEPTATATPPTQKRGTVPCFLPVLKDRVSTLEVIDDDQCL
ncbi:RRXRR domain-containing protein [Streptosporangium subroseum]|uniref:RRXRR domain-containing protein n=1 Tax=Streptosporangium subroseum TaxID=106412 RepID=UPI00352F4445